MLTNDKKVAVLLSTYNGAQYLREQLDSLFQQTCSDFHLYVRDDGSSDETVSVLEEFSGRYPQQMTIVADACRRRGAAGSFFYLLKEVDSAYYMFCDQDDVWLPEKIEVSLSSMEQAAMQSPGANLPVVAFSDLKVVDSCLSEVHPSFNAVNHMDRYERNPETILVHNVVTGCAMIFNRAAKEVSFPVSTFAHMHDEWIALCVYFKGGRLLPIPQATICYRQHSENTIGARQYSLFEKLKSAVWHRQLLRKAKMLNSAFGISYIKFIQLKIQFARGGK